MKAILHVLVIEPDEQTVDLLHQCLAETTTEVRLTVHRVDSLGIPEVSFDWRKFDVVLLDYEMADVGSGADWLRVLRTRPGLPPVVLLSRINKQYVAIRALKLGAEDVLLTDDLTPERTVDVLRSASAGRAPHPSQPGALGTRALPPDDDRVMQGLNRFRLLRKIGAGAQSRIYLALRVSDDLLVAVKLIATNATIDDDTLGRFEREGTALERIHSPHVINLYDHAFSDDCGFLALEHLSGGDMRRQLRGPLDEETATSYLRQMLSGLATVHSAGVLHRDLKPMNILLRDADNLVIGDFGISRFSESDSEHTTEAMLLGTPAYMSPEQCMGQRVDERADLYSVGVIFYEMLAGRRPYLGRVVTEILKAHISAPIPKLPPPLARWQPVLNALMEKRVVRRVASAQLALELLDQS
jgi:eukaryotic-like serine/threonine-protein kinase